MGMRESRRAFLSFSFLHFKFILDFKILHYSPNVVFYENTLEKLTFSCIFVEQLEGGHVGVPGSRDEVGLPIRALPH